MRPKSEIYNPKRDDEHPYHFHIRSPLPPPPPGGWLAYLPKESSGKEFFDFIFVYLFICFFMAKEYNEDHN